MTSLEDIANYGNLFVAHTNAKSGKSKHPNVRKCERNLDKYLRKLESILLSETYHTSKYSKKIIIDSRKEREINRLPYYPDRIVHWAILYQMEKQFIDSFSKRSHAAIPGRGIHSALTQVRRVVLTRPDLKYCLKLDLKHYFENIDHTILKDELKSFVDDDRVYRLLCEIVDSFYPGIPIGNYTSQYFANFYLNPFDSYLELLGLIHIRYMDDVIIFGKDSVYLHNVKREVEHYLDLYLKLKLKDNWQIFPIKERGIDFVGYRVYPNKVLLRKTTFRSMRRKLSHIYSKVSNGIWSEHEQCVLSSYAGWCYYCTPKIRKNLYLKYFSPILHLLPAGYDKYEKSIRLLLYD